MNKDKQKELDDRFKKYVIDSLPDFIPDENKIDIADICNNIFDLLDDRKTNNTIVAIDILAMYYKGMWVSRMSKEPLEKISKELSELFQKFMEHEPGNKSGTVH